MASWKNVTPSFTDEAARVGADMDAINALGAKEDGDLAIVRVGTWPDLYDEWLFWNADEDKWIGEEKIIVNQGDSWAMDLSNRTGAQLLDWSYIDSAVPFGKAHAIIDGPLNLSASNFNPGTATGVITVDDTTSPHSYPFTSEGGGFGGGEGWYLVIRDNYITYTGKTGTTFTGCAVVAGTRGSIPDGEYATQGYPGGWGFAATYLIFADTLFGAGMQLQERLASLMNSAAPYAAASPSAVAEYDLTIAPYWNEYDEGDGSTWSWPPDNIPPTGGLGVSASLTSPAGSGGALGGERDFFMSTNDWTDWPLATPTKKFLIPRIVGKMETGAQWTGSCLDTRLGVRWIADG
jgi:hypothetical protein